MTYKTRGTIALQLGTVFIVIFVLLGHFTTSFLYESYLKRFKVDFFNLVSNYASNINGKLLSAHRTLISVAEVLPAQSLSDSAILQEWLDVYTA